MFFQFSVFLISKMNEIIIIRIIILFLHIICTTPLYWTRIDSITISTSLSTSYSLSNSSYTILISFSLFCLCLQFLYLCYNIKINFIYCLHILFDFIGLFFCLWIALDGLTWKTYIVISIFCV